MLLLSIRWQRIITWPFLSIRSVAMQCPHSSREERKTKWGRALDTSPINHPIVDANQKAAAVIYDKIPFVVGRSFSESHISLEILHLFPAPCYFLAGASNPGSRLIFKLLCTSQQGGTIVFSPEHLPAHPMAMYSGISWGCKFSNSFSCKVTMLSCESLTPSTFINMHGHRGRWYQAYGNPGLPCGDVHP